MKGLDKFRRSSTAVRIGDLAPFLIIVVLSLVLGLSIPDDRSALVVALVASAIGAIVVVRIWLRVSSSRSREHLATSAATAEEETGPQVAARPYLVPRELPPAPSGFVGRAEEAKKLLQGVAHNSDGSPFIAAIYGVPGIGKTALAITVAHRMASSFPDGQVFVQMRRTEGEAGKIRELIEHFVTALKGPVDPLPASEEELREEYAALTQRYSVLFVIDDVPSTIDISSICPSGPKCAIIVTCRAEPDWPDVSYERIRLAPLGVPDAVSMLRTTAGADRRIREEQSYLELASRCGGEPLALRAAGTAVADRPNWDIGLISEQSKSMLTLPVSEQSSGGIFDTAYALLTSDEQRALRVLGTALKFSGLWGLVSVSRVWSRSGCM